MKTYALVVGGGSGTRMGASMPKQFLEIHGIPLFIYTLLAFHKAIPDCALILVLPADHIDKGQLLLQAHLPGIPVQLVVGGETRYHSVLRGLEAIDDDGIVMVHDAVRCMISAELIRRCLKDVLEQGSSVPVVDVRDSIRMMVGNDSRALDRSLLRVVQTPQCFPVSALKQAFAGGHQPQFTDEASVWEAAGHSVFLTKGEESNLKITFPADLPIAEQQLSAIDTSSFFD